MGRWSQGGDEPPQNQYEKGFLLETNGDTFTVLSLTLVRATFTNTLSAINTDGKGWVYFSNSPIEIGKAADFVRCVTAETNLAAIDADDRSWNYRARPRVNLRKLVESQIKR
jgi:hypothetical protein